MADSITYTVRKKRPKVPDIEVHHQESYDQESGRCTPIPPPSNSLLKPPEEDNESDSDEESEGPMGAGCHLDSLANSSDLHLTAFYAIMLH